MVAISFHLQEEVFYLSFKILHSLVWPREGKLDLFFSFHLKLSMQRWEECKKREDGLSQTQFTLKSSFQFQLCVTWNK